MMSKGKVTELKEERRKNGPRLIGKCSVRANVCFDRKWLEMQTRIARAGQRQGQEKI